MAERDRYPATTEWLAAHLDDPSVRILECTVFLRPNQAGKPGYTQSPGATSGRKVIFPDLSMPTRTSLIAPRDPDEIAHDRPGV